MFTESWSGEVNNYFTRFDVELSVCSGMFTCVHVCSHARVCVVFAGVCVSTHVYMCSAVCVVGGV